jgi:hypothetical protein
MRNRTVMGIFDRPDDAEKVRDELLEAGVARHRIVISRRTGESIVGEVPDPQKFGEAAQSSACVVSVVARSPVDKEHIAELMLRHGARQTVERRSR